MSISQDLKNIVFVGVVVDNMDPRNSGRIKVNVLNVYDSISTQDIPWAAPALDLNGNVFILPEVGKVVSVTFEAGNIYKPTYIYAEHFNINLQTKLSELSGTDYTSMRALMFDHKTQIFSNDKDGLMIDYKFNQINITESDINVNLKDNFGKINIGTPNSDQQSILGTNFLNWFDTFVNALLGNGGGPYLGNLGAPIVPNPDFLNILSQYQQLKDPKFLSHHINMVDNDHISQVTRIANGQIGDKWKSTITTNNVTTTEAIDYTAQPGLSTDTPSGDLTPYTDANGNVQVPSVATASITPSDHPDVQAILQTMQSKGYQIYTDPMKLNIVGIRRQYEGDVYSNAFKDDLWVIYQDGTSTTWQYKKYKISTMPGYYDVTPSGGVDRTGTSTTNNKGVALKKSGGLGIMVPAQYINLYQIGVHPPASSKFSGPAMVVRPGGVQQCYRDTSPGNTITYSDGAKIYKGNFGMFMHRGYPGGGEVDNWSLGCQIFAKDVDLSDFFTLVHQQANKYVDSFTYTLMLAKDIPNYGS